VVETFWTLQLILKDLSAAESPNCERQASPLQLRVRVRQAIDFVWPVSPTHQAGACQAANAGFFTTGTGVFHSRV